MTCRIEADGKHLAACGVPFDVRGVTYGSFVPRLDGTLFPERWQIKSDLDAIASVGLNVVRTYTLPPPEMLEIAAELDLRLIVGLHYEDWRYETSPGRKSRRRVVDAGRRAVAEAMERCAGSPTVMAIAVGNEVPTDVARLHGIGVVEDGLSKLIQDVHEADSEMLATYCNFPTTEYLQIEGQDIGCFNIFLEDAQALKRYLLRLHNVIGEIPLLITELGLAGAIHGEAAQAESLELQLRAVDEAGCAGATVFSWTDEWGVDGKPVEGWGFGITAADRSPKPALATVSKWANSTIGDLRSDWPRISAVVCAYNGDQLIEKCLSSLQRCDYPNLEVIMCDDGSTDRTLEIARRFPFKVLELPRGGLSAARNAGISASSGEIVAFIDADAFCHPTWPYHLALSLEDPSVAATGGPNLPVQGVGLVERAVSHSPGGPVHVLVSDDRAEHVPGCNMAYKKEALIEIEGFDPVYTAAGDDVDVCWKLLDRDHEIAFSPAAQVRHHRRSTLKGYLKQQRGYGKAERLLAARHPQRFNRLGQAKWSGFIYGGQRVLPSWLRPIVYHGYLGESPYQGIVKRRSEIAGQWALALLPLSIPVLLGAILSSFFWGWSVTVVAAVVGLITAFGIVVGLSVRPPRGESNPIRQRFLVGFMHMAQPLARTWGRLRTRGDKIWAHSAPSWVGQKGHWITSFRRELERCRCSVRLGSPQDNWDARISVGPLMSCRVKTAVLWKWLPAHRMTHRPRGFFWAILLGGICLAAFSVPVSLIWFGVAGSLTVGEVVILHKLVKRALMRTSQGHQ